VTGEMSCLHRAMRMNGAAAFLLHMSPGVHEPPAGASRRAERCRLRHRLAIRHQDLVDVLGSGQPTMSRLWGAVGPPVALRRGDNLLWRLGRVVR